MQEKITSAIQGFDNEIKSISDDTSLEEFRIKYLGRKGIFAQLFEEFKALPKDEKPKYGQLLNNAKSQSEQKFEELKSGLEITSGQVGAGIDISLPAVTPKLGSKHIITQTLDEMKNIFKKLGFSIHLGPEIESDFNNFEALNFPDDHPARDEQDTYFINKDFLMRTHTSPIQVRLMTSQAPPLRAVMPGRVYRNEVITATHYNMFHQLEGLYIDENVTFAELKSTLVAFLKEFFGKDIVYRFRPGFFPFTEPSGEIDIWWQPANGKGKWMEVLGSGMVDPNVLINCGVDSEKYTGYAFGMGVERIAMKKYGISDIRTLFDNDVRFLSQF